MKMAATEQQAWETVADKILNRDGWQPRVWVTLTLDPNKAVNKRLCKKGSLQWNGTVENDLRNIVGKKLSKFCKKQRRHFRFTVGAGQTTSGAIGIHIFGLGKDSEQKDDNDPLSRMIDSFLLEQFGDWADTRGSQSHSQGYGFESNLTFQPRAVFKSSSLLENCEQWAKHRGVKSHTAKFGFEQRKGALAYLLNHHEILLIDETFCPRRSRPCKCGRCSAGNN